MRSAQRRSGLPGHTLASASVDPGEVEKFSALAGEWWDPNGQLAPLHKLNPVRLGFIREEALSRFGREETSLRPFEGLTLLDVGCGGGLLSEPMARLGFAVTGIDASERNVQIATHHANESGLTINYRGMPAEALAKTGAIFDAVLIMEVIEHVVDIDAFLRCCASLLAPGGLLFLATINRTLKSLALAKIGAEYILRWVPPGTHDWSRFVTPSQLDTMLARGGLTILKTQGVVFDPMLWRWRLSRDTDVNYMLCASHISLPR